MNAAQHILAFGVRLYRWTLSPAKAVLFGPLGHCRFTPSCSAYALEAVTRHGALAGTRLALKRIGRCHPWGGCGEDAVPASPAEISNLKSPIWNLRPQPSDPESEISILKPGMRAEFHPSVLR
jgi:uncharacterized protein